MIARSHVRLFRYVVLFSLMLLPATGFSLDNATWNSGLNFNFYPPGARALGMGGAFVALADDATAAASNPAGIAQLTRMQLAAEARFASVDDKDDSFTYPGGSYRTHSEMDDAFDLSFGAFTTPLFNNCFTVSIFYDRIMNYESEKYSRQSPINYFYPNEEDISVHEVGLSIAKAFFDRKLMLGAGIGVQTFDNKAELRRYDNTGFMYNKYHADDSDTDVSWRMGVLYKMTDKIRLGASYTIMPKFHYSVDVNDYNANSQSSYNTSLNVPDTLSVGAAYNILPNWVAILEGRYVTYSDLMDNFKIETFYAYGTGGNKSDYSMEDIWEIHVGTEYVLNVTPTTPLAVRLGLFYEPAHDLEFSGLGEVPSGLFDGGEDLVHYTMGMGVVLFNQYQVDVGADFSEDNSRVALSMVYQF